AYAESGVCRRKVILSYFGEEFPQENCGNCDNCKNPKEKIEAKEDAVIVLKAIKELGEKFATDYMVTIITGKLTPQVKMFRHEGLSSFGIGKEKDAHFWNSLFRQMILEGLLRKDIEEYGVLKITDKGAAFLKKPKSFSIVLNNNFEEAMGDDDEGMDNVEGGAVVDERLFEMLKELRQKEAKKIGLVPWVIFLETSLQDMATLYPTTLQELEKCQGVSGAKARRYGKPFVELIARYVEENNIEKPDDFVMKSVVNKSGDKVYIIQQTDKKIPLETIAKNRGWETAELLEEMETIAASGTKLNIGYAIDEMLDENE